ncbi:hypothetical protein [Clostridium akagii]|uniref:hypothetical protein n=1 Tax=Clostridium akagii TaxID=91623 RepID=UPI0012EB108E|nr:hypothetical protein [Clostridium akagii]
MQVLNYVKENRQKNNVELYALGGPAPALTSLYVASIYSDQYGTEQIAKIDDNTVARR